MKILLTILLITFSLFSDELIIAHQNDSILSKEELRNIYLGKQPFWSDGSRIIITTIREGKVVDSFMDTYLHTKNSRFIIYWKQLMFTGRGLMPIIVNSEEEVIQYIAEHEGTIGYVSLQVKDTLPDIITIIEIK